MIQCAILFLLMASNVVSDCEFGPHISDAKVVLPLETTNPTHKLQTKGELLSGNLISVDSPKEILTNVPLPAKGYRFPVKFSDDNIKMAFGNSKRLAYDCRVEPSYIGYIESWEDIVSHESYCLFYPYPPVRLLSSVPKSKDMKPYISVNISASLKNAKHVSGSCSAFFAGGFSIIELGKETMQLKLTSEFNKTVITVMGNTGVEIHSQNIDSLSITCIFREDWGIGGIARYEVKALKRMRFEDKIAITLPANGQRMEVDVNYDPGENVTSNKIVDETFWTKVIVCVIFLMVPWGMSMILLSNRKRAANTSGQTIQKRTPVFLSDDGTPERRIPAVYSEGSTDTPEQRILAVYSEGSTRTPQSFIKYVRSIWMILQGRGPTVHGEGSARMSRSFIEFVKSIWMIVLENRKRARNTTEQTFYTKTPEFLSDQGTPGQSIWMIV